MRRAIAALLLVVSACVSETVSTTGGYRDTSVPITSSTRFDAAKFAGKWIVIEEFTMLAPRPVELRFRPDGNGYAFSVNFLDTNEAPPSGIPPFIPYTLTGPGQMEADGPAHVMWVLWVDEDHRTAVLGNPQGTMGRIINRSPRLRGDRLRAAREVMAFNGYDTSRLVRVAP